MIIDIFLLLVCVGAVSALYNGKRFSTVLSLFLTIAAAGITFELYQNWQLGSSDNFTYDWVQSRYYPVKINLFSTAAHYELMFPFFIIATVILLFNVFLRSEEKPLRLGGLVCLNLAALVLLICSENAIQLLVSACIIDIFGFYMINNSGVRRKYIFYNLLADMGLFMLFALIWGYIHTVRLADFSRYAARGEHKDLVCILLLLCLFIKSGLFMFQTPLQEWKMLSMNRIMLLSYLSTPVAGMIILNKTILLLPLSGYSAPLLRFFGAASVIWGLGGILLMDGLRRKAVYFNMMLCGLIYALFACGFRLEGTVFPLLLVCGFLLNAGWLLIYIGASHEDSVAAMGGFIRSLKLTFLAVLTVAAAYGQTLFKLYETCPVEAVSAGSALFLGIAYLLHQIFWGEIRADDRVQALLHNPKFIFGGTVATLSAAVMNVNGEVSSREAAFFGIFLLLVVSGPLRFCARAYDNRFIQTADWFTAFYRSFVVGPIKVLGRVLWLTVDFLIIERTVINSLHKSLLILINLFRRIHTDSLWALLFFLLCGGIIAVCSLLAGR